MKSRRARLLVIDDDKSITDAMSMMFERLGYIVDVANNGREAIQKSGENFYHVALIDIRLPDMSGVELLTKLKESYPKMVKIIITGYPDLENSVQALNVGADGYVIKPFKPQELTATIKKKIKEQAESAATTQEHLANFIQSRIREIDSASNRA